MRAALDHACSLKYQRDKLALKPKGTKVDFARWSHEKPAKIWRSGDFSIGIGGSRVGAESGRWRLGAEFFKYCEQFDKHWLGQFTQ